MIRSILSGLLVIAPLLLLESYGQEALIIGHRGSSYTMPENTVISAVQAWKEGADAVEIDVYPTADDQIIVIHDKSTKRTTGEDHIVTQTNADILTSLDAGKWKDARFKGVHLPLLPEVMEVIPRYKKLVVEIKSGPEIISLLKTLLQDNPKRSQLIFISFGWDVITGLKKTFPDIPAFWLSADKQAVESRWSDIISLGLDGINLHHGIIDRPLIEKAHKNNLGVLCWTVDDMGEVHRLIDIGIDGITTNRPGYIRDNLLSDIDFNK